MRYFALCAAFLFAFLLALTIGTPVAEAQDCDPSPEVCDNGVDDDCDGFTDEGDPDCQACDQFWFRDHDADGFGRPNEGVSGCGPFLGYAPVDGDCNDTNSAIHPDAVEICDNGVDDDCNGETDAEQFSCNACDAIWFADRDGDGWGDPHNIKEGCGPFEGAIGPPGDCDDADPLVNPDMSEIAENGLDDDCDGVFDEGGGGPIGCAVSATPASPWAALILLVPVVGIGVMRRRLH